jgi:hypothetical protein
MNKNKFRIGDFVLNNGTEYDGSLVGIPFRLKVRRGQVIRISQGPWVMSRSMWSQTSDILTVKMENGEEFSDQFHTFKYDIEKIRDSKIDDIAGIV